MTLQGPANIEVVYQVSYSSGKSRYNLHLVFRGGIYKTTDGGLSWDPHFGSSFQPL
ncbi:MAG: hypothetical protein IPH93_17290 [Saprospiraceae bacterium]|nr:hypothetical protein [Saprospiraceae bacterium]